MSLLSSTNAGELKGLEYLKHLFIEKREKKQNEIKGLEYLEHLFDEQEELDHPLAVSFPSSARVSDWSGLPRDINDLIGSKLTFFPHLQKFGAACKEWRELTNGIIKIAPNAKIETEPPMLLLPYNQETQTATFLEIKDSKMYNLKMPELKNQWICGASNGWLAITNDNLVLSLFNPPSRTRIKLAPHDPKYITSYRKRFPPNVNPCWRKRRFISRVVISGDPSSSNCMIAIIYDEMDWLGVYSMGDGKWSMTSSTSNRRWMHQRGYDDVIFFQGRIFAVTGYEYGELVHVFDYSKESGLSLARTITRPDRGAIGHQRKKHLVESGGELLFVFRFSKRKKKYMNILYPHKTWKFEVFKLKTGMESWDKVKSLGDQVLFLGPNDSISMSAKEFPWCKPNCIYFTQDTMDGMGATGFQWDNGVYSLKENRVVEKFDIQHSLSFWPAPAVWFRAKGLKI